MKNILSFLAGALLLILFSPAIIALVAIVGSCYFIQQRIFKHRGFETPKDFPKIIKASDTPEEVAEKYLEKIKKLLPDLDIKEKRRKGVTAYNLKAGHIEFEMWFYDDGDGYADVGFDSNDFNWGEGDISLRYNGELLDLTFWTIVGALRNGFQVEKGWFGDVNWFYCDELGLWCRNGDDFRKTIFHRSATQS